MKELSYDVVKKAVLAKGYKWFDSKLNIVGIRTKDTTTNVFNDFVTVSFIKDGKPFFIGFEATTDPGLYYLNKPMRVEGTGILVPDQYIDCYIIDKHPSGSGEYDALVQKGGEVRVYRDNNKDNYLDIDPKTIQKGYFGVNIHRAHATVWQQWVGKYSAACQVIRNAKSFEKFMNIVLASGQYRFTYTLLTENDL